MPHQKKKRIVRRQRQKSKKKREKYLVISKRDLEEIKRNREFTAVLKPRYNGLGEISRLHGIDFPELVKELRQKYSGQRIEGLDEGAGKSTFAKELTEIANKEIGKNSVRVTKTDILGDPGKNIIEATPEQLLQRFGPNKFHFVVSTFSGMHGTRLDFGKGMENILRVLKPGGMASILVSRKDFLEQDRLEDQVDKWAKSHSNISYKVGEFAMFLTDKKEIIPFNYLQVLLIKR